MLQEESMLRRKGVASSRFRAHDEDAHRFENRRKMIFVQACAAFSSKTEVGQHLSQLGENIAC